VAADQAVRQDEIPHLVQHTYFLSHSDMDGNAMAVKLVQEIGRHITVITEDSRETTFLFQCLSIADSSSTEECDFLSKHHMMIE